MLGNESAKQTMSAFFDAIESTWEVRFPFLIIQGLDGNGILEYVMNHVEWVVWWYAQDVMFLRDMSWIIDKKRHTLPVTVPTKEQIINSEQYWPVANLWAREIAQRLSIAPTNKIKVVVIEHIERMNINSANALLKSFEEPLPWRVIIWTTENARWLLDTIISRALIVGTVSPKIETFIESSYKHQDTKTMQRICALVWYDNDKVDHLLEQKELVSLFADLESWLFEKWSSLKITQIVKVLKKHWTDQQILDALIIRADQENIYPLTKSLWRLKSMLLANINADNVWFSAWLLINKTIDK